MHSKWRWFTKSARAIQFEDRMEYLFRRELQTMKSEQVTDIMKHLEVLISKTPMRNIHVKQRLLNKVGFCKGELAMRSLKQEER